MTWFNSSFKQLVTFAGQILRCPAERLQQELLHGAEEKLQSLIHELRTDIQDGFDLV